MSPRKFMMTQLILISIAVVVVHCNPAHAIQEKDINYNAKPVTTAQERAAHRDAFYDGYVEANVDYRTGLERGYMDGWCDLIDHLNSKGATLNDPTCKGRMSWK